MIFCKQCKFFRTGEADYFHDYCKATYEIKHDHEHSYKVHAKPKELNKNNNCKYYVKANLFRKILNHL